MPAAPGGLSGWAYWVFLARGCLALALGAMLLVSDSGLTLLGNFLAVYWIVGAVVTLRWAAGNRPAAGHRLGTVAGLIGIVAGILVLLRAVLKEIVGRGHLLDLLGLCAMVTGLLRLSGAFRDDQLSRDGPRGRYRFVVGALDVGLGVALIAVSQDTVSTVRLALGAWGLLAGTFLLLDAIRLRRVGSPRGGAAA
jgi:uncharacterized membrane protein HdeD (DUF308 family)